MRTKLQIVNELDDDFVFDDDENYRDLKMKQVDVHIEEQFKYLNKYVNKRHFRAFVYSDHSETLANNYEEFEKLIGTGIWFESKEALAESKKLPDKKKSKFKPIAEPEDLQSEVIEYGTDR
jgi:hypothetical protein